jgi:AcrR family transcriptional regulator
MPRGDASQEKVVACALDLFARHGAAATSLQMIADELGVTKAAVYYRFRTKEAIVQAALAPAFDGFARLLTEADGLPPADRPAHVVTGLARQAVAHRALYSVVLADMTATQFRTPENLVTFGRLRDALAGPGASPARLVGVAVFLAGLMGPPVDPDLAELSDDDLERAVADAGRRLLGPDDAALVPPHR